MCRRQLAFVKADDNRRHTAEVWLGITNNRKVLRTDRIAKEKDIERIIKCQEIIYIVNELCFI